MASEIFVQCLNCSHENVVALLASDNAEPKCCNCGKTLLKYSIVKGYIYILSNPRMGGLLKIGFSTRPVVERIAELNAATGVPSPFELEAYFMSGDPEFDEQKVHEALAAARVEGREFFELSMSQALETVEAICKRPPAYLNPRNSGKSGSGRSIGGWDFGPGTPRNVSYEIRRKP